MNAPGYAYFDSEKVIILSVGYVQVANMAIEWDDKLKSLYEKYQKDYGMTDLENEYNKEADEMREKAEKDVNNLLSSFNRPLLILFIYFMGRFLFYLIGGWCILCCS